MAVLQGWSKSTIGGRVIGLTFISVMGIAAFWGLRTLTGLPR
ncbi:MAG TPA: hypothetical protein VH744_01055 [Terriglobales bacterium]